MSLIVNYPNSVYLILDKSIIQYDIFNLFENELFLTYYEDVFRCIIGLDDIYALDREHAFSGLCYFGINTTEFFKQIRYEVTLKEHETILEKIKL